MSRLLATSFDLLLDTRSITPARADPAEAQHLQSGSGVTARIARQVPDWDLEQLDVILESPDAWQLITAGPGAGKTAVACQRIAFLIEEGVPAAKILLLSFTRTAVAELRTRICESFRAGERGRSVRIGTIDSQAWGMRVGAGSNEADNTTGGDAYEQSILQTAELLKNGNEDVLLYLSGLRHVIIDEGQDIVGIRLTFVLELLRRLSPTCGVSVFADPNQAIYGFAQDRNETEGGQNLLQTLKAKSPRAFVCKPLKKNHRVKSLALAHLFLKARKIVDCSPPEEATADRVRELIAEACGKRTKISSFGSLAEFLAKQSSKSVLVLFRRRADVLMASSFCSNAGISHRLRLSGTPTSARPWLGWLLAETCSEVLRRDEYDRLWAQREAISAEPFFGEDRDVCWSLLHRVAAARRVGAIDLVHLRSLMTRDRPPVEFCYPEVGFEGPILGTIHASKGREADEVVLVVPNGESRGGGKDADAEEGRVYYVAATRARHALTVFRADCVNASYLPSGRVYRQIEQMRAQIEIGRDRDVDTYAHLCWPSAIEIQLRLAKMSRCVQRARLTIADREGDFAVRVSAEAIDGRLPFPVAQLSPEFADDLSRLWSLQPQSSLVCPSGFSGCAYIVGSATVALSEHQRSESMMPYASSGFALRPVVKAFSIVHFSTRHL